MRLIVIVIVVGLFMFPGHAYGLWPDCEVRSGEEGSPAIIINGRPHAPLLFCMNNQFDRDDVLLRQLEMAAEADVSLFVFNVPLHASDDEVAAIVDKFSAVHPDGYFYTRIWLGAPHDWLEEHPDQLIRDANGDTLRMASPFSAAWREMTAKALRDRVAQIANGPHGERFIGVGLSYLQTGEWFYPEAERFWDYSEPATKAFRDWVGGRYWRKKALRDAWGDPSVSPDSVEAPRPDARSSSYWGAFRHLQRDRAARDYAQFLSEAMVDVIAGFAAEVKAETRGRSLVGTFYGYTFELNHNGPMALAHSGHLSFGELLREPDIDIVQAPYSYFQRAPGLPGTFHLPLDSIALHGKLAIIEDDTYTHLATPPEEGIIAPGERDGAKSVDETISLMRRNFGNAFSHRAGLWLFDVLSDGRWEDRTVWQGMGLLRRIAAEGRSFPKFEPEVAVVVSEEAVPYLRDNTRPELLWGLGLWRQEWARLGAPVGYYLLSHLPELPNTVRVLAFPNAYELSRKQRRYVDDFVESGGMVIWCHGADVYGERGPDVARTSDLVGMEIAALFDQGATQLQPSDGSSAINLGEGWNPRFVVQDTPGRILARYGDDQSAAAAMRREGDGWVVYSGVPYLPVGLLRSLCEEAGVHLYSDRPVGVSVLGPYLFVHTAEAGEYRFRWPEFCAKVERMAPGYPATVGLRSSAWEDVIRERTTVIYQCTAGAPSSEDVYITPLSTYTDIYEGERRQGK